MLTYAAIRQEVEVLPLSEDPRVKPRAASFFQLAGAADEQLCNEVLQTFNEPGRYSGDNGARWLLNNSQEIELRSMSAQGAAEGAAVSVFLGLDYVNVDIDADGNDEHVYRLTSVLSSQEHQRLMIVGEQLQRRPELLNGQARRCSQIDPSGSCDSINTMIRYALTARTPDRIAGEWAFTRQDIWRSTTADRDSRRLIFIGRNQPKRNIGSATGAYWSLYRIRSRVLAVAAPNQDFAPPELMVFAPEQRRNGILQCVLMPVAWHN
ncbi:hypothetical protein JM946_23755 [Steroidobacter sp. S1-65]|uniref:Uncharacterized protein n=1 Tax=Steroidobacter gossypii TaxID=2805490 RepID=A0ABS1X3K1_9GAMM|nr:hypothetical protein [Steroidobacter gossypii]MBM0107772.1 hypothetical protein [Steroidobacter gossypii]